MEAVAELKAIHPSSVHTLTPTVAEPATRPKSKQEFQTTVEPEGWIDSELCVRDPTVNFAALFRLGSNPVPLITQTDNVPNKSGGGGGDGGDGGRGGDGGDGGSGDDGGCAGGCVGGGTDGGRGPERGEALRT